MKAFGQWTWPPAAQCSGHDPHVLCWDGRIDSRSDLLWQLPQSAGQSDSALIAAAYGKWGVRGLAHIVGDWSVVISDPANGSVVLASDYMGVRPLYYHYNAAGPTTITWSTQLRELVTAIGDDSIDETYVAGFFAFGRCPHRTPFSGIHSVPPGHAVVVTRDGVSVQAFWAMPTGDVVRYQDERRYEDELRTLFREAVAVRMSAPAPLMAELSGGFDSSSVVCMGSHLIRTGAVAARQLATASYVHQGALDIPYIREIESHCGVESFHLSIDENPLTASSDVGDGMPDSWAPVYRTVGAVARQLGASVMCTGQGGDVVAGNWFDDSLQVAAAWGRGHWRTALRDALAWSRILRTPLAWIVARSIRATVSPRLGGADLYAGSGATRHGQGENSLMSRFSEGVRALVAPHTFFSDEWMLAPPERRKHFYALAMMRELRVLQRHEAAPDLDLTHPFMHRPLVEFLMSVPAQVLTGPGQPRRLMRAALADLWPPRLRARRSKSLFGGPWIEALRPMARALLETSDWQVVERGWIDGDSFRSRLARLAHGLECNEPQLRQVVLLEFWLRQQFGAGKIGGIHTHLEPQRVA